mmetsp:Transcript_25840/g.55266  ORF Transcript_25840/g.55266 Transcript_25840/m.55266 type:complete len:232 (-) Transcript_25840:2726-3421(-)
MGWLPRCSWIWDPIQYHHHCPCLHQQIPFMMFQHRWSNDQDRSYGFGHCQSMDMGGYSSSIFQRCLAVRRLWTLLVCLRCHYPSLVVRSARHQPQEGCSIRPHRMRNRQCPLGKNRPLDLPLFLLPRQHHCHFHAFARWCRHRRSLDWNGLPYSSLLDSLGCYFVHCLWWTSSNLLGQLHTHRHHLRRVDPHGFRCLRQGVLFRSNLRLSRCHSLLHRREMSTDLLHREHH